MRPTIRPGATSKETPSSATMPPNRTDTARTLNRAPGLPSATVRNAACATMTDAKLPPQTRPNRYRWWAAAPPVRLSDRHLMEWAKDGPEGFARRPTYASGLRLAWSWGDPNGIGPAQAICCAGPISDRGSWSANPHELQGLALAMQCHRRPGLSLRQRSTFSLPSPQRANWNP